MKMSANFECKQQQVKEHLLNGRSITSWEAYELYKATRLSAIIFNLRKEFDIISDKEQHEGGWYCRYYIKPEVLAEYQGGGCSRNKLKKIIFGKRMKKNIVK